MTENEQIEQNTALIHTIVQSFKPKSYNDYDEYLQAGRLGLLKAIRSYDEKRGKFSTLAWTCIQREIIRFIKSNKRSNTKSSEMLDTLQVEQEDTFDISDLPYLSDRQLEIIKLKLEGYSFKEIAEKLGLTFNKVFSVYQHAIKLIKNEEESSLRR